MNLSSDRNEKTKNDLAWEKIFQEYSVLEEISKRGYFEIDSSTINKFRESRLMAKFDHYANLPKIFKEHKLSILPISRSKYVLGHFNTHLKVKYSDSIRVTTVDFPKEIETIDYTNLYSESSALSCAFNTGIINDLLYGEEAFYTVNGRMSTGNFSFSIANDVIDKTSYNICVDSSQCEIDAGFESENYFLLVEAKIYDVDDFLIRQLYYPYRLWSSKLLNKKVIPVLMTYSSSSNIFIFFIYQFDDILDYNSIRLVEQRNYIISPEIISIEDISEIFKSIIIVSEPDDIPFPQANKFERIVDLLTILLDKELTKEEITANYQFDGRQTNYYTDAGRYLGLIEKYKTQDYREVTFRLTNEGMSLMRRRHKIKILYLIRKILEHQVFYHCFEPTINNGIKPHQNAICEIMSSCNLGINNTTIKRRSSTVSGWIAWILEAISKTR